ncbi:MAG: methylmalonyl Co-A mutase-associated GTPase MeaB [Desulfobacterium sp.]|nr:methylmalonyl Co-A mutase-associated GTPase MeaB [Desulfobacterium sp.]
MKNSWDKLIQGVRKKDIRAMARLITRVENREDGWKTAMTEIYPLTGKARVFGITGSPGAGKSTLTSEIAKELADRGHTVGIIAVDPSSPFSGGALLGDRLRMQQIFTVKEIYIRSMATRGMLGGLCQAARDVIRIMDAFGKDVILIETVGVGQDEIEIVKTADRVMVVCIPGMGDGIQAIKAGVMEIADLYVINKADKPGADEVEADIQAMLSLSSDVEGDVPPVLQTSALKKQGIQQLVSALLENPSDTQKQKVKEEIRIREEILSLMEREVFRQVRSVWENDGSLQDSVSQVMQKTSDPYTIVKQMLLNHKNR